MAVYVDIDGEYQLAASELEMRRRLLERSAGRPDPDVQEPVVEYYSGAGLAIARRRRKRKRRLMNWKRGRVKGFSKASRRRLQRKLAMVQRSASINALFTTLTYPAEFSCDYQHWKRDLRAFFKRLRRKFPKAAGIWRLEFQKRGAPHFHLLIWGVPFGWDLKLWLSRVWFEVVGSGDEKHLRAGTNVQRIRNWRHMMAYASKVLGRVNVIAGEMSKQEQAIGDEVGRWWGVEFRGDIPWGDLVVFEVTNHEACTLIRYFRRHAGIWSRAYTSLTVFLNCDQWAEKLDWPGVESVGRPAAA